MREYILFSFSKPNSILFYFISILFSVLFAYLTQKYSKRHLNKVFWGISFLLLWIPVAFRATGVDHSTYYEIYQNIDSFGTEYFKTYNGSPEPLYALLVYLIAKYLGNFQFVYLFSSFIALFFTYLGFYKMIYRTSMTITVMWFSATYYMTFYGLVRMSIAVGIVSYAFHFIEQRKMYRYIFFVTFASLFHYSAIFMFAVYFLLLENRNIDKANKKLIFSSMIKKYKMSIIIIIIGGIILLIYLSFPYLFGSFSWFPKYRSYFYFQPTFSVLNNLAGFYFLYILLIVWRKTINNRMKGGQLYTTSVWIMLAIAVFSILFPLTRLTYYFMPIGCYLYGFIPRIIPKYSRILLYITYLILGVSWWYYVYMMPGYWGDYILPYKMNILFF